MFKTNDLQDIIYTSMDDNINVTFNNLYPFLPNLIPSVETQLIFNEATRNIYKISFDDWYTHRERERERERETSNIRYDRST